ncbi:catecholate siderophore receptor Fiu [Solimonas terrae]|uniref:Catecholate siderophore receptor Fiu n=1 Tax=Solimonas terrae TaxID=1396819 RepID=A0A6M2BXG7_9GAMM|nr:catecholate siderophore receptor Fiu [Solimonas terrae]NGY06833.1 catecholate siderophore receptor Fiu [Solimonas terrae]
MKFRLSPIAAAVWVIHALPATAQASTETVAAETGDAPAATSPQQATQLREVKVEADVPSPYKVDAPSSPKFTQPLRDTPQTIQIIPKELFSEQGATTLSEALRNSPAVGTFYAGENGSTSTGDTLYMRGFDASSSIFVDGIRDLGSVSHDLFNIDQVEVEKGPAGTDNGRTSPSGAINLVTKQANLEDAVSGTLTTGSDGQNRATADLNQALNGLPGSALRLNVLWQDSDVAGRDHVNNSRSGIAPSLAFGLGSGTRAYLNLLYVKQDNIPDGFVPTIGLPGWTPQAGLETLAGHPVDPDNFYGTRYDHDDDTSKMATLQIEHDFSDTLKLRNIARWGMTTQNYLLTSFMSTGGVVVDADGNPVLDADGHPTPTGNIKWSDYDDLSTYTLARSNINYKDQQNRILTDQLNLRYDFDTGRIEHNLSAGLEVTREQLLAHTNVTIGTVPAANLYDPDWNDSGTWAYGRNGAGSNGRTDTESLYAFDTLKLGEQWLVTGGVRVDHYRTDYLATAACTTLGAGSNSGRTVYCNGASVGTIVTSTDADDSDSLFNWKLGVVYKPIATASLYADYALAQQPPGGANFQLSNAAGSANTVNARPQKAQTYEVGGKWDVIHEALSLNLALFRTNVSNDINSQDTLDGVALQTGRKRVQGVELSAVGNITDDWAITAAYSDINTRVTNGPAVTSDGSPNLTYTPGNAFTAWTTYRLPHGFTVGGGARYAGKMHRGTDGAVGTPTYTQSYTVWDAVAAYALSEHLTLRVNAYNLLDKEYVAAINKSGYRYTPGTPRTFLFSGDFRF